MISDSLANQCPCFEKRKDKSKKHCLSSRYLLLITDSYAALPIVEQLYIKDDQRSSVIFGSSFPRDQEYTQVHTLKHF